MRLTNGDVKAVAKKAATRAEKVLGKETTRELVEMAEQALIELGHQAERRRHRRAVRRSLKTIAKATAVVGAGAAAVLATRQAIKHR